LSAHKVESPNGSAERIENKPVLASASADKENSKHEE
jgi:hypothetical protein